MRSSTKYKIITAHRHRHNHDTGTHTIEVVRARTTFGNTYRYCVSSIFGCSRDFYTGSDRDAIVKFLNEHTCALISMEKIEDEDKIRMAACCDEHH